MYNKTIININDGVAKCHVIPLEQEEIEQLQHEVIKEEIDFVRQGQEVELLLAQSSFAKVKRVLDESPKNLIVVDKDTYFEIIMTRNVTSEDIIIGETTYKQYTYDELKTTKPKHDNMSVETVTKKLKSYQNDMFKYSEDNEYLLYKIDESSIDLYSMCLGLMRQVGALNKKVQELETQAPIQASGNDVELVAPTVTKTIGDGE